MSKESFARGFCKVAEAHGVDPVALAKYAQNQLPMSSYHQQRIADLKAKAARLKAGTPPTVTTNSDGSVSSRWAGVFRGGKLVPKQPIPDQGTQTMTPRTEIRVNNTLF